jgi:hypothetical protein
LGPHPKILMTLPNANKPLLMLMPSFNRAPG